jgi:hypothetical protein
LISENLLQAHRTGLQLGRQAASRLGLHVIKALRCLGILEALEHLFHFLQLINELKGLVLCLLLRALVREEAIYLLLLHIGVSVLEKQLLLKTQCHLLVLF